MKLIQKKSYGQERVLDVLACSSFHEQSLFIIQQYPTIILTSTHSWIPEF